MLNDILLPNNILMPMHGFGTYKIKGQKCEEAVYNAICYGYRLIDTASMYGNEEFVGNALQCIISSGLAKRSEIFITSKVWTNSFSYNDTLTSFYNSLSKLKTDYIDLYLLHNSYGYIYDAWRAITELYQKKLIRAIGVSNFSIARITEFIHFAKINPMVNQIEIHPFFNQEITIDYLKKINCIPQAWAPLAEGNYNIFGNKLLNDIASKYKKTAAQVALKWNIQRGIPIVSKTIDVCHLRENLDIDDFNISAEEMDSIFNLSKANGNIIDYENPETIKEILKKNDS